MNLLKPDAWSLTHCFGSFYLVAFLHHFGVAVVSAVPAVMIAGILLASFIAVVFLPRRRFLMDILFDAGGCALAWWLI